MKLIVLFSLLSVIAARPIEGDCGAPEEANGEAAPRVTGTVTNVNAYQYNRWGGHRTRWATNSQAQPTGTLSGGGDDYEFTQVTSAVDPTATEEVPPVTGVPDDLEDFPSISDDLPSATGDVPPSNTDIPPVDLPSPTDEAPPTTTDGPPVDLPSPTDEVPPVTGDVPPATSDVPPVTPSVSDVQPSETVAPPTTSTGLGNDLSAEAPKSGGSGIDWNGQSGDKISTFTGSGSKLSWYTDWAIHPLPNMGSLEFVPHVHQVADVVNVKAASAEWPAGTKYVLGFNEPDMGADVGGTRIDPATAATQHKAWVSDLGGSYSIGAPAVARGSKQWLSDWLAACDGGCKYDFVPFHFYGTDAQQLIDYAKDFHETFQKPLWLTEWSCWDFGNGQKCNEAEVKEFMTTSIQWFRGEGKDIVHRWSWFGAFPDLAPGGNANGVMGADGSANAVGLHYVSL